MFNLIEGSLYRTPLKLLEALQGDEKRDWDRGYHHAKRPSHGWDPEGAKDRGDYEKGYRSGEGGKGGKGGKGGNGGGPRAEGPSPTSKFLSPVDDFTDELAWYQDQGIGGSLDRDAVGDLFNNASETVMPSSHFDDMANSYTAAIKGDTTEERFKHFFDFYARETRSAETERGKTDDDKRRYLLNLVNAVKGGKTPPVNIIKVGNLGYAVVGGRTRMAAAKVAGVPIRSRVVEVPVDDSVKAKSTLNSLIFRPDDSTGSDVGNAVSQNKAPQAQDGPHELSREEAVATIRSLPERDMAGWFRNEDRNAKSRVLRHISRPEVRNAGLNIMHQVYQGMTGGKAPFDEFMNTPIKLYRAGGSPGDEPFTSYSMDKGIAENFAAKKGTDPSDLSVIEIKPKDTLGSYQTIAEAEVLIPSWEGKDFPNGDPAFRGRSNHELRADTEDMLQDLKQDRSRLAELKPKHEAIRKELNDRKASGHQSKNPHEVVAETPKPNPFEAIWAGIKAKEQAADKMSADLGDSQSAQLKVTNPKAAHHLMVHRSPRPDAPADKPFQVTRFDNQMQPLGHSYVKDMRAGIHHAWKEHGEVELA